MKLGIKRKLLFSFISIILLPVLLTLTLLLFNGYHHLKNPAMKEFQEIDQIQSNIIGALKVNPSYIYDHDALTNYIKPAVEKHNIRLQIFDMSNNLMFDSKDNIVTIDDNNVYHYLTDYKIVNDEIVAHVKFYTSKNYISIINKFTINNMIYFLLGFITLISLIVISTMYISKSILLPLKELNKATENIANGNLDFVIKYTKEDELGKFCRTFDMMRMKLKESLLKQVQYGNSRKEMIASISHDLRTPLASIKGYVEGLQDGIVQDKDDVDTYLSVIKDKTEKLDRLIDDLFQFSQLELDKLEMNLKKVNSLEILEDIVSTIEIEAKQSDINLTVNRPFPSVIINIDRYRINQVVDNLFQNAKKFIDKNGEIKVGAAINDQYLQLYVEDNGIGISDEDLPHIFETFYRGEKSRSSEYGGSGLGLAICKYIIEAHHGNIDVMSMKNKGCTFYFELPLEA